MRYSVWAGLFSFLCCAANAGDEPALRIDSVSEIVQRTKREFKKVRFNKPAQAEAEGIEQPLAPLVVEEIGNKLRPGIEVRRRLGADKNDSANTATVFFGRCASIAEANKLEVVVFVWWHGSILDCVECFRQRHEHLNRRGVRVVLGADGMPILWESLDDLSKQRVFYVSQSLEAAAKAQFGEPLSGRNFSIEKGVDETPDVIVARVLEDGPVPMGPYVYIDASCGRNITTVLCRCMASQFEEVVETLEYKLEPLESLDEKWLRETGGIDLRELLKTGPLEKLFRWPKLE